MEIDTIGIGGELATIDPLRLHHHAVDDTAFLDHLAAELEGEVSTNDPDRFHALLTSAVADESIGNIAKIITSRAGRSAAAVVTINSEHGPGAIENHVTTSGRLTAKTPALDLSVPGLSADEAAACAAIVDLTSAAEDVPTPVAETSAYEEEPFVDLAGALRVKVTEPRQSGTAGERSLLPLSAETYEQNSPTTQDDVGNLAPVVSENVGAEGPREGTSGLLTPLGCRAR
ncbi:hypothetical protein D0Z08_01340 [Nocardioides immobilis]|uniref:Uncharacterized protein n=1 Tax=Nocardioides immobilis TaxID=2049295 RepID=A0A417Y7V9_9ACTN|nr:hypothetical protein [Nocardioides immobilis]RHW28544.1 hypothetical protein D0Z08_01340 [Nocardioides immobilis]